MILEWWNDGRVMGPVGFPMGLNSTEKEVLNSIKKYQSDECSDFLIIMDGNGKEIGEFCFTLLRENVGTFDVKIGEVEQQGKGYGYQAVLKGIDYMTQLMKIKFIEIYVAPENQRAIKLYEKIGFKAVQRKKNDWIDGLGENRDTVIYQLRLKEILR